MALVIIRHRIEDYLRWKKEFDGFLEKRRAGGERTFRVAHVTTDRTTSAWCSIGTPRPTPSASWRPRTWPRP